MDHLHDWIREFAMELRDGDTVICDNLSVHKVAGVEKSLVEAGARLCFVLTYSPDLNPIEKSISQVKPHTRKVWGRAKEDMDDAIEEAVNVVKRKHAMNFIESLRDRTDPN